MKNILLALAVAALFIACSKNSVEPEEEKTDKLGLLNIRYSLKDVTEITPTLQTVIWLEDDKGAFVKSLFVSDWLAWGGYHTKGVCPTWSARADWGAVAEDEFDAVTGATPDVGDNLLAFDFEQSGLEPGIYKCSIETHIINNYNVLYSIEMPIKGDPVSKTPSPLYIPEKHPQAGDILYNVKMDYLFTDE